MMRYMTMLQHKDLSLTTSMISIDSCIMKLNSVMISLVSCSWPEVMNIMVMCDMQIKSRQSQGVPLEEFMRIRQETEDT